MTNSKPNIYPVTGFRLGTACAGIKKPDHRDLVLMEIMEDSQVATVFTRNAFCAAPVIVSKQHFKSASPRYLLVNTGNANAGTGDAGLAAAENCCQAVAELMGCNKEQVLVFSTGVIGEIISDEKIIAALPAAKAKLDETGWDDAAWGILTTDTVPKCMSRRITLNGQDITITGMAKGSGMIRPDMATMLAYIATDGKIEQTLLQECLQHAVDQSFNRISVDGDTSTNDACVLVATGQSDIQLEKGSDELALFQQSLDDLCIELAKSMVRDGEGATKLINIEVKRGKDSRECQDVAYTVAHSPLVKTAFFASDPNWGRILAAVGRAGIEDIDLAAIEIYLDDVCIVKDGGRDSRYTEQAGQAVMDKSEITVLIDLARGEATTNVWTCDFSYDYVRINAEYRT